MIESVLDRFTSPDRKALSAFVGRTLDNGLYMSDLFTIADLQELAHCGDFEITVLLAGLFLALREGSVCLDLSNEALQRRLDCVVSTESAPAMAAAIRTVLADKAKTAGLIGDDKPVVLRKVGGRELLYFQKYLRSEQRLRALLDFRLNADRTLDPSAAQKRSFTETIAAHKRGGVEFGPEQKQAIALALLRKFVVISGGPGTGKTSTVFAILQCLAADGIAAERMLLGCPTGRAAQRLTESLRINALKLGGAAAINVPTSARTLHRLLGYSPKYGNFRHHRENPIPADVLIVDETSMVDIVLMTRLLEATPPDARMILLGDKDQLPSVDAGSVLADLMPPGGRPVYTPQTRERLRALSGVDSGEAETPPAGRVESVVVLTRNYRSQTQITEVVRSINALVVDKTLRPDAVVAAIPTLKLAPAESGAAGYTWPLLPTLKTAGHASPGGCYRLEHTHRLQEWRDILDAWGRHHYIENAGRPLRYAALVAHAVLPVDGEINAELVGRIEQIFAVVNGARVLTLIREGMWGCEGVNAHLAQLIGSHVPSGRLFPGAPVLVTSNDYNQNLFNGDVGVTLRNARGSRRVVFERQDEQGRRCYTAFPPDVLPPHELAFAMTVHKSQGSEYGQVLLALPPEGAQRLQTRELIYTAITRARDLAVCFGDEKALSAAIGRSVERCSGLVAE